MQEAHPETITLLETQHWKVLLNPDQRDLGKSLVILKAEKKSLAELNQLEWEDFGLVVARCEAAITASFGPTHFNWQCLMNNSFAPGSTEKTHVHWHIAPRYEKPVTVEEYTLVDDNYPRTNKKPRFVEAALLNIIARTIQKNL